MRTVGDWLELPVKVVNAVFVVVGPPLFLTGHMQDVYESSGIGMFWLFATVVFLWWFAVAVLVSRDLGKTFSRRRATESIRPVIEGACPTGRVDSTRNQPIVR